MGNVCGKSDGEAFAQPGRVLGSAPQQPDRASVPAGVKVGGPARTLGGSAPGAASQSAGPADEARRRAAEAAEARAQASSKPTGKLGTQLQAQKKQTRTDTLKEISRDELRTRDADAAAEARNHN